MTHSNSSGRHWLLLAGRLSPILTADVAGGYVAAVDLLAGHINDLFVH